MSIALFIDENIPRAITEGLRLRGIDVVSVQEDGVVGLADPDVLNRATSQGRVLFTFDQDFLVEATTRQADGIEFAGVIYAHPLQISVRRCLDDLEIIAKAGEPEDLLNGPTPAVINDYGHSKFPKISYE